MKKSLFFQIFAVLYVMQCTIAYKRCKHKLIYTGDQTSIPRNRIKNIHNEYRTMMVEGSVDCQPAALKESMNMLQWCPLLAKEAEEVSRTCEFEHVDVNIPKYAEGVGQNLYRSCSNKYREPNWRKAIKHWFNENELYCFPDEPVDYNGHYTQLIWGETKFVGCGYTEYIQEGGHAHARHCTLYVCHYGPAGNIRGEAPYNTTSSSYTCDTGRC